jgi:hypothetical protein
MAGSWKILRSQNATPRSSPNLSIIGIAIRCTNVAAKLERTARLEARISPETLAIIRRAAEIQNRSVSEFVAAAAQEAAQRVIHQVEPLNLPRRPPPTVALVRAFKRHRALIRPK